MYKAIAALVAVASLLVAGCGGTVASYSRQEVEASASERLGEQYGTTVSVSCVQSQVARGSFMCHLRASTPVFPLGNENIVFINCEETCLISEDYQSSVG